MFVGDDIGVMVSIDDGRHWTRLQGNLPTVPVHDLLVHPREHDLVLATYGRALWTGDISPLEELSDDVLAKPAYLFDIKPRPRYGFSTQGMNYNMFGDKYVRVPNEPDALSIYYYLGSDAASAHIAVHDATGRVVREQDGPTTAGLHRVLWSLGGGGGRGGGGAGGGQAAGPAPPGSYQVTLTVGGQTLTKTAVVKERQ